MQIRMYRTSEIYHHKLISNIKFSIFKVFSPPSSECVHVQECTEIDALRCLHLLLSLFISKKDYLFCHFSPSRAVAIAAAFNDLLVATRIEYPKFFNGIHLRVALKCHKAWSYEEQNNDWFDFSEETARIAIKKTKAI